jgi:hypothetical protein
MSVIRLTISHPVGWNIESVISGLTAARGDPRLVSDALDLLFDIDSLKVSQQIGRIGNSLVPIAFQPHSTPPDGAA